MRKEIFIYTMPYGLIVWYGEGRFFFFFCFIVIVLMHAINAYRWGCVVSFTARPPYPWGRTTLRTDTYVMGGWLGPSAAQDVVEYE